VRGHRLDGFEDALDAGVELIGELAGSGRAAETTGQSFRGAVDLQRALLQVAGYARGPVVVAEVALQLAGDGRDGKRRKGEPALWVEAIDSAKEATWRRMRGRDLGGYAVGMNLRRRETRRARAVGELRELGVGRRRSAPARTADSVRNKVTRSGPVKVIQGAGQAGRATGRGGKAMAVYTGRRAAGKRAPLLVSLPIFAGASVAGFLAVRKMRRGVKQTAPGV
jgi:hypothetical protein